MAARFRSLGVEARPLTIPDVDTKAIRSRLNLSQADFAVRFGFELDTVQNWDQGRHVPDPATRVLLAVIDRDPALVDAVLTEARPSAARRARDRAD
ncbi:MULTISPECIES: helix-turn-helix domain-containing protein [unclassified Methylobacterium]|uniref:helix-turn-helix domain-containing protein n=1 Tax=unclassified Methylobacterium TaxID=2615210 RepID=UPI0036FB9299